MVVKFKKARFGTGDALGSSASLLMLGSIDACQPRRRRSRFGLTATLFWLMLITTLGVAGWLILDGFQRGIIPSSLT